MVPAAAQLDASCSAGLCMLGGVFLAAPVVMTRRDRHDAADHLVALTGMQRIMKEVPVLLRRRTDAATDQPGPVTAQADHVVP